ncbi:MAG TPA: ferrochelatase [Fibrobacteria bacterium]|nr:ferrochelatase [Fibrobacteria bacterium]
MKTGILIVNLGTPDAPSPGKVRRYLREFLSDPRVLDIPALGRWILLNLIILPFRPRKSAEAYEKIWTAAGSPLLAHTRAFTEKLRAHMPGDCRVEFAMRYGNPSIESKLNDLLAGSPDELILFPMYPQYSSASTGSTLEKIFSILGKKWNVPPVRVVGSFYGDAGFLDACASIGKPHLESFAPDHVLFSYHGLPERQIRRGEGYQGHCFKPDDACCASISWKNNYCYRAQCFETSRQLARRLGLAPGGYTVCFQSRLGRTPWIKPYTDLVITDLGRQGKKRLLVFEPSFTADCLETLEEISMRAQAIFLEAGGKELRLVPSLNASDAWVLAARDLLRKA